MWVLKPHYYGSHFYNWPYTYGLLFGLGLFAQYRHDPERFQAGYDDAAVACRHEHRRGARRSAFGLDVTDEAFWTASLDVIGDRIDQYEQLGGELGDGVTRHALRRDARASSANCSTASRATALDQVWTRPVRSSSPTPDEMTIAAEGAARRGSTPSCRSRSTEELRRVSATAATR